MHIKSHNYYRSAEVTSNVPCSNTNIGIVWGCHLCLRCFGKNKIVMQLPKIDNWVWSVNLWLTFSPVVVKVKSVQSSRLLFVLATSMFRAIFATVRGLYTYFCIWSHPDRPDDRTVLVSWQRQDNACAFVHCQNESSAEFLSTSFGLV